MSSRCRPVCPGLRIASAALAAGTPAEASSETKRRRRALNAAGPSIPGTGNPSPGDPAPTNSAEPPAVRRTDGDGNYESFKSRWIQYCAADFAALPADLSERVFEVVRQATADMLRDSGYRIVEAVSANHAIALLQTHRDISLLVTDYLMPRMTGVELAYKF